MPGGTLDPLTIPKYVTPLVIPPVMPTAGAADNYSIAVRQFRQQILPSPMPTTTVWSYGNAADNVPAVAPSPASSFNYPAFTIETIDNTPVSVRWINDLKDPVTGNYLPHLLPVDQTLHWANPSGVGCVGGMGTGVDCRTDNAASYTGPVPLITHLHGAHVQPHSDGYPQAWYLPAASNIPAGYSMKGSFFDDATGTNPGNLGYADFRYRNDQPAATLWYHDHALGMTRNNVYAGPAGFWMIRGGAFDGGIDNVTKAPAVLPGPAPVAANTLAALNTPGNAVRNAIREIPIAIQDRSFNADGSLFYPSSRSFFDGFTGPYTGSTPISTDIAPISNTEAFFNTMVVNGSTWPVLNVAPALYRLRLLNGCNSRFLNLSLRNMTDNTELPFYQIGAEQGFLPNVVMITTGFSTPLPGNGTIPAPVANTASVDQALLMGNAERADVIVDFRNLPNGTVVRMLNTGADEPFGGFPVALVADNTTTGQVMQFVVDTTIPLTQIDNTATPPERLVLNHEPAIGPATVTRTLSLNEEESAQVCVTVDIAGAITGVAEVFRTPLPANKIAAACAAVGAVPMAPRDPNLGKVDFSDPAGPRGIMLDWDDQSGNSAPVQVAMADGVTMKMVNVTENPVIAGGVAPIEEWDIYNFTMDAHPIHLHLVDFQVVGRTLIAGGPSPSGVQPTEAGFKDTVIAYPGEITKVRAKFDIEGLYVWHCHIVEHEDNEMMRPFVVSVAATVPATNAAVSAVPALSATRGATVTFTASATNGSGNFEYKFLGRKAGVATWSVARAYRTANTWAWNTTGVALGEWEFQVQARNVGSTAPYETISTILTYSVIDGLAPTSVALASSPATTAAQGTAVTFTATPSAGSGPLQYEFWARAVGSQAFTLSRGYAADNNWTWNTTGVAAGSYEIKVYARQVGTTAVFDVVSPVLPFTITANTVTSVVLGAAPVSPTTPGTPVVFTASNPVGGVGPIQYQFRGRKTGTTAWSVMKNFSTSNTVNWTAVGGSWDIQVNARSAGSTSPAEATATITYVVTTVPVSSVILGASPGSPTTPGTAVTFTATPTGGTAPLQYEFRGRRAGTTTWSVMRAYGYSNTASWTAVGGSWEIQVNARSVGSAVAEATATIAYNVTIADVASVLLTALPGSPSPAGTAVTFTATPTGGTAPIEYQFRGRRVGAATWSVMKAYSTSNTANWTTVTGNWEIQVNARSVGSLNPPATSTITYSVP